MSMENLIWNVPSAKRYQSNCIDVRDTYKDLASRGITGKGMKLIKQYLSDNPNQTYFLEQDVDRSSILFSKVDHRTGQPGTSKFILFKITTGEWILIRYDESNKSYSFTIGQEKDVTNYYMETVISC